MPRAKSVAAIRHRKIKKQAKGFSHARRKRIKVAKESILHAGQYAYHGRKLRKRDIKKLWIERLNAAVRQHDLSYSKFMAMLKKQNIELNRKMLAEIATTDPEAFSAIIKQLNKK